MYLENVSQTINSSVGLTILWIVKKKKIIYIYIYLKTLTKQTIIYLSLIHLGYFKFGRKVNVRLK